MAIIKRKVIRLKRIIRLKRNIKVGLTLAVWLISLWLILFYLPSRTKRAMEGVVTVGVITKKGMKKNIYYTYRYKDSTYTSSRHVVGYNEFRSYRIGEKFKVYLDPLEPNNSEIIFDQPVLDDDLN